ncbi:MAG: hypothetical protein EXR86_08760 [Gammaproteobacteria bacterium]|nr:hypothetical protein [Gammaproteobacteria bacterium]
MSILSLFPIRHFYVDPDSIAGLAGKDTIQFTSTVANDLLTLDADVTGIEAVTFTGSAAIGLDASTVVNALIINGNSGNNDITGTGFNDTIDGNGGVDTLDGGAGDDKFVLDSLAEFNSIAIAADAGTITGGDGTDTVFFTGAVATSLVLTDDFAVEKFTLGTLAGKTNELANINIDASALTNGITLTGNSGKNILIGSDFADTLIGGAGKDTLTGGDGDDEFHFASSTHFVVGEIVNGEAGTDTASLTGTGTLTLTAAGFLNIEQFAVGATVATTNAGSINASALASVVLRGNNGGNVLTGTLGADTIDGHGGKDTLNGRAGADDLDGGDGDDILLLGSTADYVGDIIQGGLGTDTLRFTGVAGQTLTLNTDTDGLDKVVLSTATGTDFDDVLTGGAGLDTLIGGDGNDTFAFTATSHIAGEVFQGGYRHRYGDLQLHWQPGLRHLYRH